ncbi:MAG: hypothetical protein IK132_03300 [Clostridia bacterium]|nr:hypothetical protein [Clostridia bacterium]
MKTKHLLILLILALATVLLSCSKGEEPEPVRVPLPDVDAYREIAFEGAGIGTALGETGVWMARVDPDNAATQIAFRDYAGSEEKTVYENDRMAAAIQTAPEGFCVLWEDGSLTRIHAGEDGAPVMEEEIELPPAIVALDAGTKYLTVASAETVWQRNWEEPDWRRIDPAGIPYQEITAVSASDDGDLWLTVRAGDEILYRMNGKGEAVRVYDEYAMGLCYADGSRFWFADGSGNLRAIGADGEVHAYQRILVAENTFHRDPQDMAKGLMDLPKSLCVSDHTVAVVWETWKKGVAEQTRIVLCPLQNQKETVNILASTSAAAFLNNSVLYMTDAPNVRVTELSEQGFSDVLSAKLLAGDDDFDLVYTGQADLDQGILFDTLIRHHLYVDLYENEELARNLGAMYDGLSRAVEADGEAVVLPMNIKYRLISVMDEELIPADGVVTAEDVWALCDTLLGEGGGRSAFDWEYPYASAALLAGMAEGYLVRVLENAGTDEDAVRSLMTDFFEKVGEYNRAGVLFGSNPVLRQSYYGQFPFAIGYNNVDRDHRVISAPVFDGESSLPLEITGYWFVNANAAHREDALGFLALLTNEQNRTNVHIFDSPLYPQVMDYHFLPGYANVPAVRDVPFYQDIGTYLEAFYARSAISKIGAGDRLTAIVMGYLSGQSTPDEAAANIVSEVVYQIKG